MERLAFGELISTAWQKFKARPGLCIGMLFVYYFIVFAAALAEIILIKFFGSPIFKVISVLVGAYAYFGVTRITLDLIQEKSTGIGRFGDIIELYPKTLGQYLLNLIIILAGFVLLIIPGLIMFFGFSMGIFLMLEKKTSIIDSFKTSWAMTKGYKWKLFFIVLGLLGINLLGLLCLVLGLLVTVPLTMLVQAEVYRRLYHNFEQRNNATI